jgi:hypothetical protein
LGARGFSLLVAGALLTRLDSALLIALPFARLALRIARRGEGPGPALTSLGALTLPALVLVGGWFAWKVPYYGEWLPNTFFAKTGAAASVRRGLAYVLAFLAAYALWPFAAGALIAWRSVARGIREWIAVAATLALWLLYVVLVGGDFMEFRMFVAILPLVAIVVAWMIAAIRPRIAGAALLLTAIAASAYHARTYEYERETESTRRLNAYVADADQGWILAGRKLGEAFGEARDSMLIATTAAGAIPFESRIPALDMHGLMDRWIARNGFVRASTKPGHRRFATLEYLLERRVNLVIGHPHVRPIGDSVPPFGVSDFVEVGGRSDAIPPDARLVELPLGTGYALTMLELVRSPAVDRLIERRGLRTAAPSTP